MIEIKFVFAYMHIYKYTYDRNPTWMVLGDKMFECASMINVRPRFLPGGQIRINTISIILDIGN